MAQLARRRRIEILVLDFTDAYHAVPLAHAERRFACCDTGEHFLVYRVLGFGGRVYPLVYCRVASLVARSTQAFLDPELARLQLYMDDPALTVAGDPTACQLEHDLVLIWWLVLGVKLAWQKGVVCHLARRPEMLTGRRRSGGPGQVEWIGVLFRIDSDGAGRGGSGGWAEGGRE